MAAKQKSNESQSVAERLISEAEVRLEEVTSEIVKVEDEVLGPLNVEKEKLEGLLNVSPKVEAPVPAADPEPAPAPAAIRSVSKRSRKGGTHAENAVKYFSANPGASASDYAKAANIKPNYLYRVLSGLVDQKVLEKDGRGYKVVSV